MPYRRVRRYVRRKPRMPRRPPRRQKWYNKKYSVGDMADYAYKGVKYLTKLVNSEVHKADTLSYSATNVSSSGIIGAITPIAQGDTLDTRTGNSILVNYVNFPYTWNIDSLAGQTFVRMIIFVDLQQVGDAGPSVTDVLASANVNSSYNVNTVGRFKILKDWRITLNDVSYPNRMGRCFLRMSHHVRYNGANGTDIQKGGLYFLAVSSEATNQPELSGIFRVGWYDN